VECLVHLQLIQKLKREGPIEEATYLNNFRTVSALCACILLAVVSFGWWLRPPDDAIRYTYFTPLGRTIQYSARSLGIDRMGRVWARH
jgi:hypothetical protein